MEELDENGDGEIDFQEFLAMMQHQAWSLGFNLFFVFYFFRLFGLVYGVGVAAKTFGPKA